MMDAMVSANCHSHKSINVSIILNLNGYLPSRIRGNSLLCACNLLRKWGTDCHEDPTNCELRSPGPIGSAGRHREGRGLYLNRTKTGAKSWLSMWAISGTRGTAVRI